MTTYFDALRIIFSRADYERGARPDQPAYAERVWRLARMEELLEQLGSPQNAYPSVHIAGTKGKGSVTAMIEAILRASGYSTGMYTSPHLHTFRERIRVNGSPISEESIVDLMTRMRPILAERPEVTVFEIITALGMCCFAEEKVDFAVFEVGLGGRLDATNVLQPLASVITSISKDHTKVLGDTIAAIAGEKAGIIKANTPAISSPQRPEALEVIARVCRQQGSRLTLVGHDWCWSSLGSDLDGQQLSVFRCEHPDAPEYPNLRIPLLGAHQLENACTAVAAIEVLRSRGVAISHKAVERGLATVAWPGRMEVLNKSPLLVVDGAHNAYSITKLLEATHSYLEHQRLIVVFGAGHTHKPEEMLSLLTPKADCLIVTQSQHPKATEAATLLAHVVALGHEAHAAASVPDALQVALDMAEPEDLILATGSLFVVAEMEEAWAALKGLPAFPKDPPGAF